MNKIYVVKKKLNFVGKNAYFYNVEKEFSSLKYAEQFFKMLVSQEIYYIEANQSWWKYDYINPHHFKASSRINENRNDEITLTEKVIED